METILKAEHISRDFEIGDGSIVNALTDINLEVGEGQLVCLRGRSGSGKTTLINILGALDRQTGGDVFFLGKDIGKLSDTERDNLRRKDLAFVFQSVALISTMTAYENVEFALRLAGYPLKDRKKRAKECLARVGLEKRMTHRPGELSGGEQQRVAIARAFVNNPSLIIADEPTGNIDPVLSHEIVRLLKEINACGTTILMVTHEHELVRDFGGRLLNLSDGNLTFDEYVEGDYENQQY